MKKNREIKAACVCFNLFFCCVKINLKATIKICGIAKETEKHCFSQSLKQLIIVIRKTEKDYKFSLQEKMKERMIWKC